MSGSEIGRLILSRYRMACIDLGIATERRLAYLNSIPVERKDWTFEQRTRAEELIEAYNLVRGKTEALEALIEVTVRS